MKKFSYYNKEKELDRIWFESSNVYYGECDDSSQNQYKTVRITFKNGLQYQYNNVLITDWLDFKNAESQGKFINGIFKKRGYEYVKLNEKADLAKLDEEYKFRSQKGMLFDLADDMYLEITDYQDKVYRKINLQAYGSQELQCLLLKDMKTLLEDVGYTVFLSDKVKKKYSEI